MERRKTMTHRFLTLLEENAPASDDYRGFEFRTGWEQLQDELEMVLENAPSLTEEEQTQLLEDMEPDRNEAYEDFERDRCDGFSFALQTLKENLEMESTESI